MHIDTVDFDADHYASDLETAVDSLTWSAQGNTHTLVMRGEFGAPLALDDERRVDQMRTLVRNDSSRLLAGEELVLDGPTRVRLLRRDPVSLFTLPIPAAHSSYAVFACELVEDSSSLRIYVPNAYCTYRCDVPAVVDVTITSNVKTEKIGRLFSRKTVQTVVSYALRIAPVPGYDGNGLEYGFDGCPFRYPITRQMMGNTLTVPAFTAPNGTQPPLAVRSAGGGYEIRQDNRR